VGKKGHRSRRGQGEIYAEPKQHRQIVLLTHTGRKILYRASVANGTSLSETIEQLLRQIGPDHGVDTEPENTDRQ
jgi:hypothetical protein